MYLTGTTGDDTWADAITGDAGNNLLQGFQGDDNLIGSAGNDTIDGGEGVDDVQYWRLDTSVRVNLTASTIDGLAAFTTDKGELGRDSLIRIEEVILGQGDDTVYAAELTERIYDLAGDDLIDASRVDLENNLLRIFAGSGNDTIIGSDTGPEWLNYYSGFADAQGRPTQGVNVDLFSGVVRDGWGDTDLVTNIDWVSGTDFGDTLRGNDEDNRFSGQAGSDWIFGGGGRDRLYGGAGDDTLDGGGGMSDDVSYYFDFEDGGPGGANVDLSQGIAIDPFGDTDVLRGIEDVLATRADDTVRGSETDNFIETYAGDDLIEGLGGDDFFRSFAGNDTVDGGNGFDFTSYQYEYLYGGIRGVEVDLLTRRAVDAFGDVDTLISIEGVRGTQVSDTITGDVGVNTLVGLDGDDVLRGLGGGDLFFPGAGADRIAGGTNAGGRDRLSYSDADLDAPNFVSGISVQFEGVGFGGVIDFTGAEDRFSGIEAVYGTDANDTMVGSSGDEYFRGNDGDDRLTGQSGADILQGGAGADWLDGGTGFDTASYEFSADGVTIDLERGTAFGGTATGDSLSAIEAVIGSGENDVLTGTRGSNRLEGGVGNDNLNGGAGRDTLDGGDGNDIVSGGSGHDVLSGGAGRDRLDGGAGVDIVDYSDATSAIRVGLHTGSGSGGDADGDMLFNFEHLTGGSGADTLTGDGGNNRVSGGDGADRLFGRNGNDTLLGDDGNDILRGGSGNDVLKGGYGIDWAWYSDSPTGIAVNLLSGHTDGGDAAGDTLINIEYLHGSTGDDTLTGDNGRNYLTGFRGDDMLNGKAGNDLLRGHEGDDELRGGSGADRFDFNPGDDQDTILDFVDDSDSIDLRSFSFNTVAEALGQAMQVGEDVEFDFGNNDLLIVLNTQLGDLNDDILI